MTLLCEILTTLSRASAVEMLGLQRGLLKIALETFEHHGINPKQRPKRTKAQAKEPWPKTRLSSFERRTSAVSQ